MIAWIREADREINCAFLRGTSMESRTITDKRMNLCWKPSPIHQFTLNVDRSVKATRKTTGIGGIIRTAKGFSGNSEYAYPTVTELRTIITAMQWAWDRGCHDVELQSDAKEAISWIRERANLRGIARDLVQEAICWCAKDWNITLRVIFRKQNRSADALALLGTSQTAE